MPVTEAELIRRGCCDELEKLLGVVRTVDDVRYLRMTRTMLERIRQAIVCAAPVPAVRRKPGPSLPRPDRHDRH